MLSPQAETALRELGFQYTTRLRTVLDFQTGRTYDSQSLVWSVRSRWRRLCSLAWNALLFQAVRNNALMRISIHPVDRVHRRVWRQIRRSVARALEQRTAFTYERWLTRQHALETETKRGKGGGS